MRQNMRHSMYHKPSFNWVNSPPCFASAVSICRLMKEKRTSFPSQLQLLPTPSFPLGCMHNLHGPRTQSRIGP